MRYVSVCSGIEAATVAWHDLGWQPVAFSEIEPFPSAVLAHHYPSVPNLGDMTKYKEWDIGTVDLLVGGTPCQSFSVAGLRKGLDDPRGNLALVYCGILDRFKPKWFVWENVPGVLSSSGGRDFGSFLGAVAQLGYGFAYRVLDAQYFGVAQRRRRVFVVGRLGDWRRAAAVLFERESLSGNPAPSREKGKEVARGVAFGVGERSDTAHCLRSGASKADKHESTTYVAQPYLVGNTLSARMYKGINSTLDEGQTPILQPIACDTADTITVGANQTTGFIGDIASVGMAVRRLTPVECERLQGFPDNYTNIPWRKSEESPDGPRYKALGNSMAVPVMKWIGQRIQEAK